ncbi:MAG: iron chelate uptake ABC transporter family permease subunit [Nitriliruptorales bacterium]|nr:iron chelate uptake ABC transporter family permease subunit [Nitriliruptorales bacterium]
MDWLILEPFQASFMQRGLIAGLLAVTTCSVVGTWVILRSLSFMGDALAHGVIPGIAVAYLIGFDLTIGAAIGAAVMVAGVTLVGRHARLPEDAGIGLLFVGMLGLGVIIISRAGSFAVDLTGFLFGAVLGVTWNDIWTQGVAAVIVVVASVLFYRAFLVLSFDERKAQIMGFNPQITRVALLGLIALAVVASFRTIGSLLVFGLLVAPPATASLLARRVPVMMAVGSGIGAFAVSAGLLLSYHYNLAAGATMSTFAVAQFFVVLLVKELASAVGRAVRGSSAGGGPPASGPGEVASAA